MAVARSHEEYERDRQNKERAHQTALEKNPLLDHGLGDLIREMHILYHADNNVILPENRVPETSRDNYKQYKALQDELNRREGPYLAQRTPLSERRF